MLETMDPTSSSVIQKKRGFALRMIGIAAAIATLAMPAMAQPTRPRPSPGSGPHLPVPGRPRPPIPRACPPGYSWGYGCISWAPAPPGKLFGACLFAGRSCVRNPGPIQ
jgi:hypothetical protein